MADGGFRNTCETLFKGMDGFISSKTVVGDAIELKDGTVILPLMDVSFGVGAGAMDGKNQNGAGGIGGKMSPSAVLIISQGTTKLVSVKNQDMVTKIVDMVPDFVNKFTARMDARAHEGSADFSDGASGEDVE